ncbi:MAG: hypothetical protein JOZ41_13230 [Chloroflexi bacterium]|nr:hypothetical protein [Chloroflexota bacterium]
MSESDEAGEAPCFLNELDDAGELADPRHLIRWEPVPAGGDRDSRTVVVRRGDEVHAVSELAPRPSESLDDYRVRLQLPEGRTAAWRVALMTDEGPIAVGVRGLEEDDPRAREMLRILRALIA